MDVGKSQRVPLSVFFGTLRFFSRIKMFPLQFSDILQQIGYLKIPKCPLFQVFRHCETFFQNLFFSRNGPPFNCDKFNDNFGSVPLLAARHSVHFFAFSLFEYCKLTLGSPFAIFEPCIWRRLGPVPSCIV